MLRRVLILNDKTIGRRFYRVTDHEWNQYNEYVYNCYKVNNTICQPLNHFITLKSSLDLQIEEKNKFLEESFKPIPKNKSLTINKQKLKER